MFEGITTFLKKVFKPGQAFDESSKDTAKERLHLVLMQDRANVSADFLDLMKQEIIDVIKKYIEVDEKEIDVRLTNQSNEDGTNGAPALYANIPILNIRNDVKGEKMREQEDDVSDKNEDDKESESKVEKTKKKGRPKKENKKQAEDKEENGQEEKLEESKKVEDEEDVEEAEKTEENDESGEVAE